MVSPPAPQRHEFAKTIHATFLYTTARLNPFSMQLPASHVEKKKEKTNMWVVCCKKTKKIHTEGPTSHVEKKTKTQKGNRKQEKNKEVPGFELANFDWVV